MTRLVEQRDFFCDYAEFSKANLVSMIVILGGFQTTSTAFLHKISLFPFLLCIPGSLGAICSHESSP